MRVLSPRVKKLVRLLQVMGVILPMAAWAGSLVFASGEAITGANTATTQIRAATPVNDITITGTGNDTVPVKLLVTSGTLAMSTTTGLTFTGSPTGSTLYFSGTRTDVNAALATLTYTRNTVGSDTLEISLVAPGEVFLPENGHLYEYVSSTLTWPNAKTAAEGRTKYGATGYLTTITSQNENDFVSARLTNAGWMGASDSAVEGAWRWVTGPENGTQFWQGIGNGNTVGGNYANWNTNEPNESGNNEDCGQFLAGGTGKWNDLPCSVTTLPGYVVEYGATGNMPSVAAKNISLTTVDTTAPTVPGAPSTTTPTTDQTPTWAWSASSDAGVGLANPAYSVQWSQSSTFASGVSSATTNSATYTNLSNLADGTWYFRVLASDTSANTSAYSSNGSVVIDTTGPSAPGLSATTVKTTNNTPGLSWNSSVDTGAGLANPAYTMQWSQSSTFASGISSTTTNGNYVTTTALADGTWYLRVRAADLVGNTSAWSPTVTYVIDNALPSTPGAPSTATPTNNKKPTWTWTASTDSGAAGLRNPAYNVQWSQSSTFSSGITSSDTNNTSFTQPTNLADGTWYFRVQAVDDAANYSVFSAAGSVVIDTAVASISNILVTPGGNNSQTITWTTDKLSSSQIVYGTTADYGNTTAEADMAPRTTSHTVMLNGSGLVPCTIYHYRINSIDALGNQATSADMSFITAGCVGGAVVTNYTQSTLHANTGGIVSLPVSGGNVSLNVPINFTPFSPFIGDFQIKELDTAATLGAIGRPSSLLPVGRAYDLRAMRNTTTTITNFDNGIGVTLPYTANDSAGISESSLAIYHWTNSYGWQKLSPCDIDSTAKTVTCTTFGFSIFALFGSATPVTPTTTSNTSTKKSDTETKTTDAAGTATPDEVAITDENSQTTKAADKPTYATDSGKNLAVTPANSRHAIWWWMTGLLFALLFFFIIFALRRRKRKDEDDSANVR